MPTLRNSMPSSAFRDAGDDNDAGQDLQQGQGQSSAARYSNTRSRTDPDQSAQADENLTKTVSQATYDAVKGVQYGTAGFFNDVFGEPQKAPVSEVPEELFEEILKLRRRIDSEFEKMQPVDNTSIISEITNLREKVTYLQGKEAEWKKTEKELRSELSQVQKDHQLQKEGFDKQFQALDEDKKKVVFQSIQFVQQQEAEEFGNFWFPLQPNTYGTAIWALLVLELDAFELSTLFAWGNKRLCSNDRADKDATVPKHQKFPAVNPKWKKWGPLVCFWWLYMWLKKRAWPFLNVSIFFVVGVGLFFVAFLLQVGFTYLLNESLQMKVDLSSEGAEYICGTQGQLQLISVGFFISLILGNIPQALKTLVVVWASHAETTELRGLAGKRYLYTEAANKASENEKDRLDKAREAKREKAEEKKAEAKAAWDLQVDDQALKDAYDEAVGELQRLEEKKKEDHQKAKDIFNHRHTRSRKVHILCRILATVVVLADLGSTGFLLYVGVRYIFWSGYSSLNPSLEDDGRFGGWDTLEDGSPDPEFGLPWMSNTNGVEEVLMATLALQFILDIDEVLFQNLLPACIQRIVEGTRFLNTKWMPGELDETTLKDLGQPMQKLREEDNNYYEVYQSFWTTMIPFMTFIWIAINLLASVIVVLFIRAEMGCARFDPIDMPVMPRDENNTIISELENGDRDQVLLWLFPMFVVMGVFGICALKFCILNYVCRGPFYQLNETKVVESFELAAVSKKDQDDSQATPDSLLTQQGMSPCSEPKIYKTYSLPTQHGMSPGRGPMAADLVSAPMPQTPQASMAVPL